MRINYGWFVYGFSVLFLVTLLSISAMEARGSSVYTGAGSAIDEDGSTGKLVACIFTQNKDYADPSWISEVMSPVSKIADGGSELVKLPVYLLRSVERPLEQGISGRRQDASNCFRYEKRANEQLTATYSLEDYAAVSSNGDTITADTVSFSVEISSDTGS